ncbi:von Willebrand factor C domain-containing protein 2-like [Saccostrea echinata]|uniref:von Willebrand factor C domain-containing protein 2-like n=1 Tax=Saccostrea echinata TaxID=191078 RepID=UPI002A83EB43|nr:von Willebrand factor C domain-containing protein 2-like [Saccostrea echinata]
MDYTLFLILFLLHPTVPTVPPFEPSTARDQSVVGQGQNQKICFYEGTPYPLGSFKPAPCKDCVCSESGHVECADVDCFDYQCVDKVQGPEDCCPVCPNGQNCKAPDNSLIGYGEEYNLSENIVCRCDKEEWGELKASCDSKK